MWRGIWDSHAASSLLPVPSRFWRQHGLALSVRHAPALPPLTAHLKQVGQRLRTQLLLKLCGRKQAGRQADGRSGFTAAGAAAHP